MFTHNLSITNLSQRDLLGICGCGSWNAILSGLSKATVNTAILELQHQFRDHVYEVNQVQTETPLDVQRKAVP